MTVAHRFTDAVHGDPLGSAEYQAGVCNIGPAEIRRRRRTGHIGLVATVGLFGVLVALDAPREARLLVGLPAMLSASGYIQAAMKFCAGYAWLGAFNFGDVVGERAHVTDAADRRRDRARAIGISVASLAVGLAVGAAAFLLPV